MNKELIKKYKAEFDHWLNGGEILTYDNHHGIWHILHPDSKWDFTKDLQEDKEYNSYGYVINDEYVEFRKALAEGKTIQLNEAEKFSDQNRGWVDLSCTSLGSSTNLFPAEYYRIKPEEPQFKVGDWVRAPSGCIYQINETNILHGTEHFIPWQPKSGEWCWFTHDIGVKNVGYLKEFKEISADTSYRDCYGNKWRYCEPFLNSKPSWFKD